MNLSEEWKSRFPICAVFEPPLLISSNPELGPLSFTPIPHTLSLLLSSPSLPSPRLLFPSPPQLSISRFLSTSSFTPYSTSSSLSSLHNDILVRSIYTRNLLHFLQNPITKEWIVFFPTGLNLDQVGFVVLEVKDLTLRAKLSDSGDKNCVFVSRKKLFHSIVNIVVGSVPVVSSDLDSHGSIYIGYLLAYTLYSVQWFAVKFDGNSGMVSLVELYNKVFKTAAVVHVCLCSKLPEFSAVLLDDGSLFLFDLECRMNLEDLLDSNIKGRKLRVPWERFQNSENAEWLGCEFGWHPKLLIVARSNAVFLVDFRSDQCNVSCIMNMDVLGGYVSAGKDRFLAFSRAGSTGFEFVVATNKLLILCDVREPLHPILQWDHGLDSPSYIDVLRLSDMRSSCKIDANGWASKSGFCILLGSLWDGEFGLFCYGPLPPAARGSFTTEFSKICKTVYAWDLPSKFPLGNYDYCSGSSLMKEELLKDSFNEWINWQQKKEMVLGFGILRNDHSSVASEVDEYGGFTLIRLLSNGRLESQRYQASWSSMRNSKEADRKSGQTSMNNTLHSFADDDYKFPKKFKYFKYGYLKAYLNSNLPSVLDTNMKKYSDSPIEKNFSFDPEFHALLYKNMKAYEVDHSASSPSTTDIFNDVKLPSTISEISSRRLWSRLPMELLSLAFSNYSKYDEVLLDQKKVSLEFLGVPDLQQLPPFILRDPSSCSNKGFVHQLNKAIVGPIIPLSILDTLHQLRDGHSNVEDELSRNSQCDEIMHEAREMTTLDSGCGGPEGHAVSLSDDREDKGASSLKLKPFLLYQACSFKTDTESSCAKIVAGLYDKDHVAHGGTNAVGQGMLDDCFPIKLDFDTTSSREFGLKESAAYKLLERQFTKKLESCDRYQEFLAQATHNR